MIFIYVLVSGLWQAVGAAPVTPSAPSMTGGYGSGGYGDGPYG